MKTKYKKTAILQILILVVAIFGFAGFLNENVEEVSASSDLTGCCLETKEGALCQDLATGSDSCKENLIPTQCKYVSDCEPGCCIDEKEGLCSQNSMKKNCESDGGLWNDDANCNIGECQKGCCVLGSQAAFVTEQRCERLSSIKGLKEDFRPGINTEVGCLMLSDSQERGACVLDKGNCRVITKSECLNMHGEFYKGYLCSNPSLETICEKQSFVGCADGGDEVYWFDSCGNTENIYSSDKNASWNNGKILSKNESCNSDSANINSENCGNCNYYLGSKCSETDSASKSVKDGSFVCKDLGCYDTYDGTDRINGESWCVYDSSIGSGTDAVGSRYWRHMCIDGEEIVEPCADFRQEICVEKKVDLSDNKKMSQATCVINEWRECYNYNSLSEGEMKKRCSENKHCQVQKVWNPGEKVSGGEVTVCVPQYPPGFDFYSEEGSTSAKLCSVASQKVKITRVKDCGFLGVSDNWECVANCIAETETWTQSMNKWCTSLGDCGAYVNIEGVVTTGGYSVSGKARALSSSYLSQLKQYNIPNPKIHAELSGEIPEAAQDIDWMTLVGGGGGMYMLYNYISKSTLLWGAEGWIFGEIGYLEFLKTPYFSAAGAVIASYFAGEFLAKFAGLDEKSAQQVALAGVLGSSGQIVYTIIQQGWTKVTFGGAFTWGVIAIVAMIIIMKLKGCGEQSSSPAGFKCELWQPPVGGKDCEKCNEDEMHPCSEYRCKSLGAACELINADSSEPSCVWVNKDDVSAPAISTWKEILTENYSFENYNSCPPDCSNRITRNSGTGCLEAYQSITVGIKTDEPAKCKFDFENKDYDEMQYSFGGIYQKNHSTIISSPGVKALNLTGEVNLRLNIKCQDVNGNTNQAPMLIEMCLDPEPDTTAPYIVSINPENRKKISYSKTKQEVNLYVNEPTECRYSYSDKVYSEMEKEFICETELENEGLYGWPCFTTLNNLTEQNTIYIRCKDQPNSPDEERNVNSESYNYTLSRTSENLAIDSISPDNVIYGGFEPVTVEVKIKTSEGADNGKAVCYYSYGSRWVEFLDTGSDTHKQKLSLLRNYYEIPIKCEDDAGNLAYKNATFSVDVDNSAPLITRVFKDGNRLKLITNEGADCYYGSHICDFNSTEGTSMTTGFSTEHFADWKEGQSYYVKCEDVWGNHGSCMIISPASFI